LSEKGFRDQESAIATNRCLEEGKEGIECREKHKDEMVRTRVYRVES
jgi:hypothetical protein